MTLKQEYMKERRRIQRFMRSAEKRGFIFEDELLPKIPKRITQASIRRLSNIRPEFLYSHAYYITPETAEAIPAKARLAEVRKAATTKRRATLAMQKQRAQARQKMAKHRQQQLEERAPAHIPYYPRAENLGYERLMSILQAAYGSYNSFVMRGFIRDYVNRVGLIAFVQILATDEGKQAIREAEEIAYESTGDAARRWCANLENLFLRYGVLSPDELKQFQDIRESEAWQEINRANVTGKERTAKRKDIELNPIATEGEAIARKLAKYEIIQEQQHAQTQRALERLEQAAKKAGEK